MSKTLDQLVGGETLTGMIQEVVSGVPEDLLPQALFTVNRTVPKDNATYFKVTGTRKSARRIPYGADPTQTDKQGLTETPVKLAHFMEEQSHDASTLMNLMNPENGQMQQLAQWEIDRQTAEFGQRFRNVRISSVHSLFARNGVISFDSNGNLEDSDQSGLGGLDIDFSVPSGNTGQLNTQSDGGGSTIIGASWGTATTDIIGQIKQIKKIARQRTGLPLRHALYGENILGYLVGNNDVQEFLKTRSDMAGQFQQGEIPDGFMGLRWWSIDQAFYDKADGTTTEWFGGDDVIFLPDPSPMWYEMIQGSYPVPRGVSTVTENPQQQLSNITVATGAFSYSVLGQKKIDITQVAGDTFLPILKNPAAVYFADVTP